MSTPTGRTLKSYYVFWSGQQISSFGSSIVSFVIIWYITITTRSALYLGLASALTFGSRMVIQLISGYITDYFNRKWILGIVDMLQAVATSVLMVLFYLDTVSILAILAILGVRGLFEGLHSPAKRAIIPTMVPEENLQKINSLSSTARSIINLLSPPVAAFLLVLFPDQLWMLLSLDMITFLVAVLALLFVSIPDIEQSDDQSDSFVRKLTGGIGYLRSSTGLLPLLFIFAAFNFLITPVSMLTPLIVYSEQGFDAGESIFALTMMASNLGFLIMSVGLTRYKLDLPAARGVILGFSVTITGLLVMSYSIYAELLLLYVLSNCLVSLGLPIVNVFSSIIWQSQVPANLQGRVISVRMLITTASLPIVMVLTGFIAEIVSFSIFFLTAALLFGSVLILVWVMTDFSRVDQPIERSDNRSGIDNAVIAD